MFYTSTKLIFRFKTTKTITAKIPKTEKPINSGNTDVLTKLPIKCAIGTANTVERKPLIAAPTPAICPKGCIANARKFPNKNPTAKNCAAKKEIST